MSNEEMHELELESMEKQNMLLDLEIEMKKVSLEKAKKELEKR